MSVFQNFKLYIILFFIGLNINVSIANSTIPCKHDEFFKVLCDLCGCATSSGSFGFGTLSNSNFVGVRYIYQNFESKNGIFQNSPISKERFNTIQLWAQIPINENFYISANLPYQHLSRDFNNIEESINGIGDASVIGWYKFVFYKKEDKSTINFNNQKQPSGHSIQVGLGAKLPTGEFEQRLTDNINPGFQVGTGSLDGIFSLGYNYGGNKIGVNTLFSYYLKGENKNDYQFGNQISYSANLYTVFKTLKTNIMPFIGVSGDHFDKITQYGETLSDTDGYILNSSIGAEVAFKKYILGTSFTLPVSQDLFGGNVTSKQRLSVYLNFAL